MKLFITFLTILTLAHAEHGGTKDFDKITGEYFRLAKTPIVNEKIPYAWSTDEQNFFYEVQTASGVERRVLNLTNGTEQITKQKMPSSAVKTSPPREPKFHYENFTSPDGKWRVEIRFGNVILIDTTNNQEHELAKASELFGEYDDVPLWAPDSSKFMVWQYKKVDEHMLTLVRSSPEEKLQPDSYQIPYTKPGDAITTRVPWIFYTDASKPLEADRSLLENPFETKNAQWRSDSKTLTYEYIERGFGKYRVLLMDAEKRSTKVIINEESKTFIYAYGYCERHDLKNSGEILWLSERDGWNHLYLFNGSTGKLIRQLTKGNWLVKKIIKVDEEKRTALLEICGYYPTQDPYFEHYISVNLEDGKITTLTSADGTHTEPSFSPLGNYYVSSWSRINHPPVHELHKFSDGSLVKILAEADATKLLETWKTPEPFVAKDRNGQYDIYGVIVFPPHFDPNKKYPVVEHIYAGPQDAFVEKDWSPWLIPKHELAVHDFIVVQCDGLGTAHRGKAFHDVCYKNLKDAGLPDRIAWMKAAAQKYPQMDLNRVGIFGGSAGGQNALGALLFHGEFYKAAAADCGCHDNRMDKIWWNEQWMDYPMGKEYITNSNVTHANKLQGHLMLTVGELDQNVDPSSTLQVVNALLKADKDFEFYIVPNGKHGCGEQRSMQRRRVDFFKKWLGTAE